MRERIPYLDALRCLAIFLVVLLHNDAPVVVNTACYGRPSWYLCMFLDGAVRLGVPLFFMISGCLLLNGTGAAEPAAFYRKKLPRLLVPLAVWNVIYHWTNAWQFHTDTGLLALLQKAFNRGTGYHMWYIYVLLGLYLLCPFLKRMVDGCTPSQLAALVGIILLPTAVLPLVSQMVSWSVVPLDTLMPGQAAYFLLGYGLGRWSLSLGQQRVFLYLGGAAGYLVCTAVNLLSASPQEHPPPVQRRGHHLPLPDGLRPVCVGPHPLGKTGRGPAAPRPAAGLAVPAGLRDLLGPSPGAGPGDQAGGGRPDCPGVSGRPAGPDLWDLPGLLPGGIPHPNPEKTAALSTRTSPLTGEVRVLMPRQKFFEIPSLQTGRNVILSSCKQELLLLRRAERGTHHSIQQKAGSHFGRHPQSGRAPLR